MELEHDGNDTETELIISEVEELLRTANVLLKKKRTAQLSIRRA